MPIFRYNEQPGNYYAYLIEGHGDDANDGLTPETAVATLDRLVEILDTYAGASARVAVIRKNRIYNETITYTRATSKPITFEFIGGCEIDGSGGVRFLITHNGAVSINGDTFINARFINYATNNLLYGESSFNGTQNWINCYFENFITSFYITASSTGGQNLGVFTNCTLVNVVLHTGSNNTRTITFNNSNIINCSFATGSLTLSAINSNFINNAGILPITTFNKNINYCNVFGLLGSKTQNDLVLDGVNINGIGTDPLFNDETFGIYTLKTFSPCLYRGQNAAHIGLGEGFYLTASQLLTNAETNNNFQVSSGRLTFIDPNDNALLQTYPIDAGSFVTIERADLVAIIGTVGTDISSTAVVLSHWYPAYNSTYNYHTGAGITDGGIKYKSLQDNNLNQAPATETLYWERMTWESGVSYSAGKIVEYTDGKWYKANTATSTSWVAGEWDEVVLIQQFNFYIKTGRTYDECNDADYSIVPFNDVPLIDVSGKGNSEDDYDPDTGASITFRFISIKIHAKTVL